MCVSSEWRDRNNPATVSSLRVCGAREPPHPAARTAISQENRSSRRHRNDRGQLRSVVRAFTAAEFYRSGVFTTLRAATEACGVNTAYIVAAATVLKTEDLALMAATLNGTVQLLAAAKAMKQTADLIAAYRSGDDLAKLALGQAASVEAIWDEVVWCR